MAQLTKEEKLSLDVEEKSGELFLHCAKHLYFGPGKTQVRPVEGCRDCWMVYYMHHFKGVPPERREQEMEDLKTILMHLNEQVEAGTFDFVPFRHAEIAYQKGTA